MKALMYVNAAALTGVSLLALGGAAQAQESGDREITQQIVVTASGRAQALQEVPISVTAIGQEQLENAGIEDVRDLQQIAPSFKFSTGQSNAAGATAQIRGIGTGADNVGFESAVGFFIDGVYRARPGIALSNLPEVERVEVLRGPQGTLYGKNTTAGVISVTTAGPEFDWRRFGDVTIGDFNQFDYSAGVTGPVIEDVLAVRLEGGRQTRDGHIENFLGGDVNDRDRWNARGQALWDITPDATLRVIVDGAATDEQCCSAIIVQEGPTTPALNGIAALNGLPAARPPFDPDERRVGITPGRDLQEDIDEFGSSAELDWAIGEVNFTSISAYRNWEAVRGQDIDFSAVDRAFRDGQEVGVESFTQEFRFQGEKGRLDWLVGAYLGKETLNNIDRIKNGADSTIYANALINGATGFDLYGADPADLLFAQDITITSATTGSAATLADNLLLQACLPLVGDPVAFAACVDDAATRGQINAIADAFAVQVGATGPAAGTGQQADQFTIDGESWSIFTHNIIELTDKLSLTLGLRYNNETKDLSADLNATGTTCDILRSTAQVAPVPGAPTFADITAGLEAAALTPNGAAFGTLLTVACNPVVNTVANGNFSDSRTDKEWNGTASLAYQASDDILFFGGYSRGFKGGGYNLDRSALPLTPEDGAFSGTTPPPISALEFDPEFVDAYELGMKWTNPGWDGSLNVTLFYSDFEGFQLNAFNGFNFENRNVAQVISKGVEVETLIRPTDYLTLVGAVVYNQAEFGDDDSADFRTPLNDNDNRDLRGDPLGNTPEWTLTGSLTYDRPITDTLRGVFYIDGRWLSEHEIQSLGRSPSTDNDAYAIFNGRVGLGHVDEFWAVEFFVRNITDELYNILGFEVPEQGGTFAAYPSEPRTYGVTLKTSF